MNTIEEKSRGGKGLIYVAVGFLLFLGIAGFLYWFFFMRNIVSTDDARLDADLVNLAPQVSGVLTDVKVIEGGKVQKGQLMFTLGKDMFKVSLQHTEAARDAAATINSTCSGAVILTIPGCSGMIPLPAPSTASGGLPRQPSAGLFALTNRVKSSWPRNYGIPTSGFIHHQPGKKSKKILVQKGSEKTAPFFYFKAPQFQNVRETSIHRLEMPVPEHHIQVIANL